jgi:hypothetical protein
MFSQDLLTSIVETATVAVPCLFLLDMVAKIERLSAKLDQVVETLATQAVETPVAETVETPVAETVETQVPETPAKKRGRPKGSKNKPKATVTEVVQTQVPVTEVVQTQAPEDPVTDAGLAEAPSYQAPSYQAPSYQAPSYQAPSYQAPSYQAPAPAETVRSKTKTRASYRATQDKALVVKTEPTGRIVTATEARSLCKTQEVLAKINSRWCRVTGVGSTTVSCTRGVWANHDQVTAWLAIG